MVQVEDAIYTKLQKDADDNRQLIRIIRMIIFTILFLLIVFMWGKGILELDIRKRSADLDAQIAIMNAESNAKVLEIEKGSMTMDEYIEWINARK